MENNLPHFSHVEPSVNKNGGQQQVIKFSGSYLSVHPMYVGGGFNYIQTEPQQCYLNYCHRQRITIWGPSHHGLSSDNIHPHYQHG